jgi:hypothetical protein
VLEHNSKEEGKHRKKWRGDFFFKAKERYVPCHKKDFS